MSVRRPETSLTGACAVVDGYDFCTGWPSDRSAVVALVRVRARLGCASRGGRSRRVSRRCRPRWTRPCAEFRRDRVERMSGGEIAGLIAAVAFVLLVGVLAVPLIKLGS